MIASDIRIQFGNWQRKLAKLVPSSLTCIACLLLSGCPGSTTNPQTASGGPSVQIVETTGDQTMLLQAQPSVAFATSGGSRSLIITVDAATQYQQMDGFGGSLTDSSSWLIWNKLSASQQSTLMHQLFSPSAGIGISFLRQPMGASDFSASSNYSYDDMPAGQTDPNLTNFSVTHDAAYIIPLVKQALSINPNIKVVALPWSPPAWMKSTGTMNGGNMNTAYFHSLAQYFVDFVQAYQQQGHPRLCPFHTE